MFCTLVVQGRFHPQGHPSSQLQVLVLSLLCFWTCLLLVMVRFWKGEAHALYPPVFFLGWNNTALWQWNVFFRYGVCDFITLLPCVLNCTGEKGIKEYSIVSFFSPPPVVDCGKKVKHPISHSVPWWFFACDQRDYILHSEEFLVWTLSVQCKWR